MKLEFTCKNEFQTVLVKAMHIKNSLVSLSTQLVFLSFSSSWPQNVDDSNVQSSDFYFSLSAPADFIQSHDFKFLC